MEPLGSYVFLIVFLGGFCAGWLAIDAYVIAPGIEKVRDEVARRRIAEAEAWNLLWTRRQ